MSSGTGNSPGSASAGSSPNCVRNWIGSHRTLEEVHHVEPPRDSTDSDTAAAIDRVSSKAAEWAALPPSQKRDLFAACLQNLRLLKEEYARAACVARGYDFDNPEHGHLVEEAYTFTSTVTAGWLQGAITLLDSLAQHGHAPQGKERTSRPDGTTRVVVFPTDLKEKLAGDSGRWMGVPIGTGGKMEVVIRGAPEQFSPSDAAPSVTGVLGAGNTEIPNDIIDPLCKLNSVVVYKSNPVMACGAGVKEKIFAPLIERGYLAVLHGGPSLGKQILESPKIDRIAMTGSHKTFDRIVWGDRDKADPSATPIMQKPIIAELGSVNPYIVIPGDAAWSSKDIEHQADALVAYKMQNGGHICAAPQVIVTCKQWPQREAFVAAVRAKFSAAPQSRSFYPGSKNMYQRHVDDMGAAAVCPGNCTDLELGGESLPPAFQCDVDSDGVGLRDEAFAPVIYEVALDSAPSLEAFFPQAVDFCHQKCWGSLTCTVIVDDSTKARADETFQTVLDSMKFGAIGVNIPPSSANVFTALAWGAFPGNDARDVQSGIGQLGNFCCYNNVEKVILQSRFINMHQFHIPLNPRRARKRGRRLADVFAYMSYWRIVKFASADFFGI